MVSGRFAGSEGPIRLGMVGGGQGAFIGGVHRIAARLDGEFQLVAGALASSPERARASGQALGLAEDRIYDDFTAMARPRRRARTGSRRWRSSHRITPTPARPWPSSSAASTSSATSR
jgi:hypothetical protein